MRKSLALIGKGYWGTIVKKYIPDYFNLIGPFGSQDDLRTLLKRSDVDAVFIATPINTHYEIIKFAIQRKKHIFTEKPITTNYNESVELNSLAKENNIRIGVDYVQVFSPSIKKLKTILPKIGNIEYIEMGTKHLGRFMDNDVYWLLASHHLSILGSILNLNDFDYQFEDNLYYNGLCTDGSIKFKSKNTLTSGRIDVSTNYPNKEMYANIYGQHGTIIYNPMSDVSLEIILYSKVKYKTAKELEISRKQYRYDETHNLKYAMKYFSNLLEGKEKSNVQLAIDITKIISQQL